MRAWLISPDVKDTEVLEGTRHAIERDMVSIVESGC